MTTNMLLIVIAVVLTLLLVCIIFIMSLFKKLDKSFSLLNEQLAEASFSIDNMYKDAMEVTAERSKFISDKLLLLETRQLTSKQSTDAILKCVDANNAKINALSRSVKNVNKAKISYRNKRWYKDTPHNNNSSV